jgi:hypothetical protein
MALAYSRKHWRHTFRPYLRMMAWPLPHTRLRAHGRAHRAVQTGINRDGPGSTAVPNDWCVLFLQASEHARTALERSRSPRKLLRAPLARALAVALGVGVPHSVVTHGDLLLLVHLRWQQQQAAPASF